MFKKQFVWILLSALPAVPAIAEDLTADDIIARNIETRGGMDALKAVQSMGMKGNLNMGGMELAVSMVFKRPNKIRVETEVQGMKAVQACDGETGWAILPMMGSTEPAKMADDQLKEFRDLSDFDGLFVDYKEKGHTVELVGKEDVEGTEAYKLKVTTKDGDVSYYYFDSEHFLVFRLEGRLSFQGTEIDSTANFSDYKEVGDIVLSHSRELLREGTSLGLVTINEVELNVEVDDSQFAFPEKPAETAEEKSEG